ncbi:MAG: DUF4105 domain-containing protein [Kiritimatiellia bacterium]
MFTFSACIRAQLRLCVVFFILGALRLCAGDLFPPLWSRVEELRLWEDPEWWTLVHYHRTMWGSVSSRMDDPRFFLHPEGKHNRKLELEATLRAFCDPQTFPSDPPVACRFPARRKWLLQRLELSDDFFPGGDCLPYLKAVEELDVESAAVVYPSAYLNSPASMFGHLLLVLDRRNRDRLLSRAVNYAANVEDTFGPLFAVKGIFGLYDGVYTLLPYYEKVEEYAAVNRRDIWEYPLNLNEEELDFLLRHVWELQGLESRYFFFKENCAFNLLYPLQVARPSLHLVRRFRMSAVPVSLLQQLEDSGITEPPLYRPSKATLMKFQSEQLDKIQMRTAREWVEGRPTADPLSAELLEFVLAWIQYLYTEQELSPEAYRERIFPLLRERSKIGKVETPPLPAPAPPDAGHAPRRVSVYAGADTVTGDFLTGLRLRAAYHDWLDDPTGYPPGSSIRMFEADVQSRPEEGTVFLNNLTLMDIRSQSPPEPWVRPLSWAVAFGAEADPLDPEHHRGFARFASGLTRQPGSGTQVYLMLSQLILRDTDLESNWSWEPGLEWGGSLFARNFSMGLRGWHTWGVLGYEDSRHRVEGETRWFLTRDFSVGLSVSYVQEEASEQNLVLFNLNRTF